MDWVIAFLKACLVIFGGIGTAGLIFYLGLRCQWFLPVIWVAGILAVFTFAMHQRPLF